MAAPKTDTPAETADATKPAEAPKADAKPAETKPAETPTDAKDADAKPAPEVPLLPPANDPDRKGLPPGVHFVGGRWVKYDGTDYKD